MPKTVSQIPSPSAEVPMSLLQSLMSAFEAETGLRMSFDDLGGMFTGVHCDVPAMRLDIDHQLHSCAFCQLAKSDERGEMDCVLNKLAVNRLVIRSQGGIEGFCHLGLFDLAEPLIYQGRILGVFFYGSAVVKGQESLTRQKIRRYCARRGISAENYLKAIEDVQVIEPSAIPRYRETLHTVASMARHFCEASGVRPDAYRKRELRFPYTDPENAPYVVKETIRYIISRIDEPFIVKELAAHLSCHPDFLSRKFKQYTGVELSFYIQQIRVDRAKRLLENPKMDIGMVALQAGFSDRVHFSKVFRRITGFTPGQFQRQLGLTSHEEPH